MPDDSASQPITAEAITAAVTDPTVGRGNARALEQRLRWGVDAETRAAAVEALGECVRAKKLKPRTLSIVVRCLALLHGQDQADVHHLEGQRVNLTATLAKAPDEEARELLTEMRGRERNLTPRAGREG